jgi:hypothetical protein
MRTLTPSFLSLRSLRSTLFVLAAVGAVSSLVACTGDDTNPPVVEAPSDAGGDATSAKDGSSGDSSSPSEASPGDSSSPGDSASPGDSSSPGDSAPADSAPTDSAAAQG